MADYVLSTYFDGKINSDFFDCFCGEELGHGVGRYVHALKLDPTLVCKIEVSAYSFQNAHEWDFWQIVKDTHLAKYFAPCVRIAACGMVLIQKRTMPILPNTKMPTHLPTFITDTKHENFGVYDGRVVCHDYGELNLLHAGWKQAVKLQRVKWWSLENEPCRGGA